MEPIDSQEDDGEKQLDQITTTTTEAAKEGEEETGNQNGLQENGTISVSGSITASSSANNAISTPSYMGKHRLNAALTQLNHQIQIIQDRIGSTRTRSLTEQDESEHETKANKQKQEELDELETLGQSSLVCRELVTAVESIPDALLPEIRGPPVVGWDRWFQGGSRARKRWI